MRVTSSPAAMLAMFVLGACTTVAVQSSAAPDPSPSAEQPTSTDAPSLEPTVVPLDEAPRATAPNGKGSITHLALGDNAYLGLLRMDPDGSVPSHRDPTEEYIHVLEGAGTMTIDGQRYAIEAGTTVFMPADAEVSFQNGGQELVAIQVFAGPEPAAKYDSWNPID